MAGCAVAKPRTWARQAQRKWFGEAMAQTKRRDEKMTSTGNTRQPIQVWSLDVLLDKQHRRGRHFHSPVDDRLPPCARTSVLSARVSGKLKQFCRPIGAKGVRRVLSTGVRDYLCHQNAKLDVGREVLLATRHVSRTSEWADMKDYITRHHGRDSKASYGELREWAKEAWEAIPDEWLKQLLEGMSQRCRLVYKARGGHINH
ncbi:hypothetical protein F5Y09DRAFT_348670 [Xylaria sp. FL1042]|nr:hypothetical protein F5Y09DRAFT_348670 [Xylaria sp. FL1042]